MNKPVIDLNTVDGNAFSILAAVREALLAHGVSEAEVEKYTKEATAGDYDHLLITTMDYVDFV